MLNAIHVWSKPCLLRPSFPLALMKRTAIPLVGYSSSEDEDGTMQLIRVEDKGTQPPGKKRKLPPVSSSIVAPGPVDNSALHQGRIRATPHVEGQFVAHVYVPLPLEQGSLLHKVYQDILHDAKKAIPTLHYLSLTGETKRPELHISLSRPILLRAHQREDLKRAVKKIAKTHKAFTASFATLSELINDEKTRTFLTMEVGAGYHEMCALADGFTPALQSIRQQEYYVNPRFHASIAWALLNKAQGAASNTRSFESDSICTPSGSSSIELRGTSPNPPNIDFFPTISHLPPEHIKTLNNHYGSELSSSKAAFDVQSITLKIGKDFTSWKLVAS